MSETPKEEIEKLRWENKQLTRSLHKAWDTIRDLKQEVALGTCSIHPCSCGSYLDGDFDDAA